MVFKRVRGSLSAAAPAWAFSMLSTLCVIQDHPHISRAVRVRLRYEDQPQAPLFCVVYLVAVRFRGAACRISGRGSRSHTGDRGDAIDAVPATRTTAAGSDGSARLRLCDVDRA
jgi:hypothetical protein